MKHKGDYEPHELDENGIPKGPPWLTDWKWWVGVICFAVGLFIAKQITGN